MTKVRKNNNDHNRRSGEGEGAAWTVISVNIRLVCRCTRIVSDIVLSSGIEDGPDGDGSSTALILDKGRRTMPIKWDKLMYRCIGNQG